MSKLQIYIALCGTFVGYGLCMDSSHNYYEHQDNASSSSHEIQDTRIPNTENMLGLLYRDDSSVNVIDSLNGKRKHAEIENTESVGNNTLHFGSTPQAPRGITSHGRPTKASKTRNIVSKTPYVTHMFSRAYYYDNGEYVDGSWRGKKMYDGDGYMVLVSSNPHGPRLTDYDAFDVDESDESYFLFCPRGCGRVLQESKHTSGRGVSTVKNALKERMKYHENGHIHQYRYVCTVCSQFDPFRTHSKERIQQHVRDTHPQLYEKRSACK